MLEFVFDPVDVQEVKDPFTIRHHTTEQGNKIHYYPFLHLLHEHNCFLKTFRQGLPRLIIIIIIII